MTADVTFPINGMLVVLVLIVAGIAIEVGRWFLDHPDVTPLTRGPVPSQPAAPRRPAQPLPALRTVRRGSSSGAGRATPGVRLRPRPYDWAREETTR